MRLSYVIKFVAEMDRAVAFYRDALGLPLRFQSPEWSEFETGSTTLALHMASDEHPAGSVQLGLGTDDLPGFYAAREQRGIHFTAPPEDVHGVSIARFLDCEGAECSIGGI